MTLNITHTETLEGDASPTGFVTLEEMENFIKTAYMAGWLPNSVVRAKKATGENFPLVGLLLTKQHRKPDGGEISDKLASI